LPNQHRVWQLGNARKFVEPLGGRVVVEFFDIGQSRSVPWERRAHASQMLAALKDPGRGWSAIVVGEGRCRPSLTTSASIAARTRACTCCRSDSLIQPSTLINILCDGLRASNLPPNSGTPRIPPPSGRY
jgi:hypothetical protein